MFGGTTDRYAARIRAQPAPQQSAAQACGRARETIIVTRRGEMVIWREKLFVLVASGGRARRVAAPCKAAATRG